MEDHTKTNWTLRLLLHLYWLEQVMHSHLTSPAQEQLWELSDSKAASDCPQLSLEIKVWGQEQMGHTVIASLKRMEQNGHFLTPSLLFSEVSLCDKEESWKWKMLFHAYDV